MSATDRYHVTMTVSVYVDAADADQAIELALGSVSVSSPAELVPPRAADRSPVASLLMGYRVRIGKLARELGVSTEQIATTVLDNHLPIYGRSETDDQMIVSESTAEHIRTLYRNAAAQPCQEARPTPERLREEFTRQERRDITDDTPKEHW
jgi:hypothetical protein